MQETRIAGLESAQMPAPLIARLLGPPRFAITLAPVDCASKKAVGLFAYLLLTRKAHSRRELAALFWGQRDEIGRASLRAALHRLPAEMSNCLHVDRETIGLAVSAELSVDVDRFEALADADDLESLDTATTLYGDELLKDFEADATPEFDDWLHGERVRLGQRAQNVFERVLGQRADRARKNAAAATSERESALATGLRWVSLMPGAEAAHRWLMRIYVDMGRRDAALAQYELCQRFLAVNHGRAPSRETRELHDSALGGDARAPGHLPAPRAGEQSATADGLERTWIAATSFLGRLEELAELDRLLDDPACRLVTLHGMGGAGKTRLAHAVATQVAARFANAVTWVAVDAAASPDGLPAAIAQALGRELPPHGARADAIAAMLAGQQRLLVLDNLESLLGGRDAAEDAEPLTVVLRILECAPRVRILVTSREVLGLQEEWVYEVRGLAYAPVDAVAASSAAVPAVQLFAERARQAYLGFSLSAEMPHVQRICRIVEGLPLGLELAAAWVRTIPCGDIAEAIEREAATLRSRHRNRPGRHDSLDAVVAYSWNLLGDEQRNALAALGVFVGGFTRDAAERIADAPLRTLSVLVDKALVRRQAEGRYDLHELVRQFALARLEQTQSRRTVVMRRYVDFFAAFLLVAFADSRGPAEAHATARFRTELANLLAAWRGSIDSDRLDIAERIAAPLIALLHTGAMVQMAIAEGERSAEVLKRTSRREIAVSLHMQRGRAAITGGRPDIAERELDAALSLAHEVGQPDMIARCIYYRAAFAYQQGDINAAEAAAEEVLPLANTSTDHEVRCLAHNLRGTLANMASKFDMAESHLRQGLAAAREQGAPSLVATMLCSLAVPLYYRGLFAEAAAMTREAATIFEALGRAATATMVRGNLAALSLAQGDLAAARADAELAVRLSRESGDENELAGSLNTLGDVLLAQRDLARARAVTAESLHVAEAVGSTLHVTEAHYLLAGIEVRDGHRDIAFAHLLSLRDALTRKRLSVRVPMLILATAEWAMSSDEEATRTAADRWLHALGGLDDIDITLRDKARVLQLRLVRPADGNIRADASDCTLGELEAEVTALLAGASRMPPL